MKMIISEKIKALNNKVEKNEAQYNLQTANIPALSTENVSKYKFLTGKDFFLEKDLI